MSFKEIWENREEKREVVIKKEWIFTSYKWALVKDDWECYLIMLHDDYCYLSPWDKIFICNEQRLKSKWYFNIKFWLNSQLAVLKVNRLLIDVD